MADQAILREYMVALGYKIDQAGQRKFGNEVTSLDKRMAGLGKTVVGVAAVTTAFVTQFALGMEKLYYSSKRTGSTIGNIKALEYGGKTIGLTAETIRGSLENMARALRSNPGLTGLLNSLGVAVKGRDMSDVVTDMVGQLKKMPFFVAQRYAEMFGMDPDTLFMMAEGLEKMKASASAHKDMAKDMGVDLDKAAESAIAYSNALREMSARAELLGQSVATKLLPHFLDFTSALNNNMGALAKWINKHDTFTDAIASLFNPEKSKRAGDAKSVFEWITTHKDPGASTRAMTEEEADAATSDAVHERLRKKDAVRRKYEELMRRFGSKRYPEEEPTRLMTEEEADAATSDEVHARMAKKKNGNAGELFTRLEKQYGLPSGLLDRVWAAESARGKAMLSPKGAKGHFGFMDPTAQQYGVTDPNDLENSATGSAKMWSERIRARGGDVRAAAADYNWGMGNVNQYGLKRAPAETRDYMDKVAGSGVTVEQTNHITVTGVKDPDEAAAKIGNEINLANRDAIRNNQPRVR